MHATSVIFIRHFISAVSAVTLSFNVQLRTALLPSYLFPNPIFHELHLIVLYDCNLC